MASLKEIKGRIAFISSTRKITSAMKMVASAKLHKAQEVIENMYPYERKLKHVLLSLLDSGCEVASPFTEIRAVKRVAIVVFSSNTSLCGGFNTSVIKYLTQVLDEYKELGKENVLWYPVGGKVADGIRRMGWKPEADLSGMADKPSYESAISLADTLITLFSNQQIDKVELLYNHFRSTSSQLLTRETYLPVELKKNINKGYKGELLNFIIEPSAKEVLDELLPKVLRLKLYTVSLDSNAAEHAARTMAMQMATDNANELLQNLTILYNKSRQQTITNELLDIVGGSMR